MARAASGVGVHMTDGLDSFVLGQRGSHERVLGGGLAFAGYRRNEQ
jgi:hypothetical protein